MRNRYARQDEENMNHCQEYFSPPFIFENAGKTDRCYSQFVRVRIKDKYSHSKVDYEDFVLQELDYVRQG